MEDSGYNLYSALAGLPAFVGFIRGDRQAATAKAGVWGKTESNPQVSAVGWGV